MVTGSSSYINLYFPPVSFSFGVRPRLSSVYSVPVEFGEVVRRKGLTKNEQCGDDSINELSTILTRAKGLCKELRRIINKVKVERGIMREVKKLSVIISNLVRVTMENQQECKTITGLAIISTTQINRCIELMKNTIKKIGSFYNSDNLKMWSILVTITYTAISLQRKLSKLNTRKIYNIPNVRLPGSEDDYLNNIYEATSFGDF